MSSKLIKLAKTIDESNFPVNRISNAHLPADGKCYPNCVAAFHKNPEWYIVYYDIYSNTGESYHCVLYKDHMIYDPTYDVVCDFKTYFRSFLPPKAIREIFSLGENDNTIKIDDEQYKEITTRMVKTIAESNSV